MPRLEARQVEPIALVLKNSQSDLATKAGIESLTTEFKAGIDHLSSDSKSDICWLK